MLGGKKIRWEKHIDQERQWRGKQNKGKARRKVGS
jgi:hypothetical protein